jgi:DNA-binding transcriptional MerR regulator
MVTVSTLARRCGVSRSTVLYYESIGLLKARGRTASNYRVYGERELLCMRQIRLFRDAGLPLEDIRALLRQPQTDAVSILRRRLDAIDAEIARLRGHQQAIARLLPATGAIGRLDMITKEKWVAIMRAAGFTEDDMHRWHAEFERTAPAEHQEFLEFLRIPAAEIAAIREHSRSHA